MDIVYSLKNASSNPELTYSLRSLINVKHDRVFLVGGCPSNINKKEVIHIPTVQSKIKWQNSTNNFKLACMDSRLSNDFILMNDDFFILKPIDPLTDLNLHRGTIKKVYTYYVELMKREGQWTRGMRETSTILKMHGIENPLSYELHIPMLVNKMKYLKLFEIVGKDITPYIQPRSLYGNLYYKNSSYIDDVKLLTGKPFDELNLGKFLSCSDATFKRINSFLDKTFKTKCKYEL